MPQTDACNLHSLTAQEKLALGTGVEGWSHAKVIDMSVMHTESQTQLGTKLHEGRWG